MGAFFDNLHVLMNEKYDTEALKNELSNILKLRGFSLLPEGSEGDVSVMIYESGNSSWVSIASDAFMFDSEETIRSYADPLSKAFNTDIIAATCYDSDYLRLALLNAVDNTDGWINVGKSYESLVRKTKVAPWKKLVKNTDELKSVIKNYHACAEEAFAEIAEMIGMQPDQTTFGCGGEELLEGKITTMVFSAPEGEIKLPEFKVLSSSMPAEVLGNTIRIAFLNMGSKSKGIVFLFLGDCIENDEITIEDPICVCGDRRYNIELKRARLTDGSKCYTWEDKDFQIPPAVNENLPMMKKWDVEFEREIDLMFELSGNPENVKTLRIVAIPLSNYMDGQACWYDYREYC